MVDESIEYTRGDQMQVRKMLGVVKKRNIFTCPANIESQMGI